MAGIFTNLGEIMKLIISAILVFLATQVMAAGMLKESEYKYVKQSIGKGKPYFLEVGSDTCHSCVVMGKMLYKITQKHPQFNIHFINVKKERDAAHALDIRMIPTQIIYDKNGDEVYRNIGVLSEDKLNDIFVEYGF